MADVKITDLVDLTDPANNDVLPLVDVSGDVTRKVQIANLVRNANNGSVTAPSFSFDGDSNTGIYRPAANQIGFTTGGGERLRITSGGNVGIGTSNPTRDLVVNNGSGNAFVSVTSSDTGFAGLLLGDQTFDAQCQLTYSNNTDSLQIKTANTEQMRITADGNVGIGTSSPTTKLQVKAGSNGVTDYPLTITNSAVNYGMQFGAYGASNKTFGATTIDYKIEIGGDLILDTTGNVGIGTSAPDANLKIYANNSNTPASAFAIRQDNAAETEATTFSIEVSPNDGVSRLISNATTSPQLGFYTGGNERLRIDSSGNVGIGTSSPYNNLVVKGTGNATTTTVSPSEFTSTIQTDTAYINLGQVNGLPAIQGSGSGTSYKLLLNPFQGNVGIGTSSPSSLLHLASNAPYITFEDKDNNQDWQLQATAWFALRNQTTSSELLRIAANGNVGIGTTAPSTRLHVSAGGDVLAGLFQSSNTSVYATFMDANTTANNKVRIGSVGDGMRMFTGGTDSVRITSDGKFGIGTTNPLTPLHVLGDIRGSILAGTGNRAVYSAPSGTLTNSSSDATLKTDVVTLTEQIEIVKQLNPVAYNWIDTGNRGEQREIGFIAQEVEPLIPEVIGVNSDETLSVDYPKITAVLTKALQEAIAKIETLEQRLTAAGL